MREILIGTHNRHKTAEISRLLSGLEIKIRELTEFPEIGPVEENGKSLLENSRKKANTYGTTTGIPCLADDTGLEVEALRGAPGVYSARYASEGCSYKNNCDKLLKEMKGLTNRRAVFKTVVTFFDPVSGTEENVEGVVKGDITESEVGTNGFGYDPVFYVPEFKKTYAELTIEEKNRISHRGKAVQKMREVLENKFLK